MSALPLVVSTRHPATSAPFRVGYCPIRQVMDSLCLSAVGIRFLTVLYPLRGWPALTMRLLGLPRPQRGYHVPHRQDVSDELASLRRERGTVSAGPLTPTDHGSLKDVSVTCVPLMHYGASIKASHAFNSAPTFPRRDFRCDSLLSLCFYCLLETPQLPATPRQYGNRLSVLAQPGLTMTRHSTYATSCRTSDLITSGALLDYITGLDLG
jgi:hypothetical protein